MKGFGGAGVKLRGIWCAGCAAGVRTDLHYPLSSGSLQESQGRVSWGSRTPMLVSGGGRQAILLDQKSVTWIFFLPRSGGEGATGEEMVGWHLQLNGCEFEQALGDSEGQGSLACCSPWGRKESDMTEQHDCVVVNNNTTQSSTWEKHFQPPQTQTILENGLGKSKANRYSWWPLI